MWLDRAQMELWVKETIKLQEFFLPFLKILPKTKQQQFIMIFKNKTFPFRNYIHVEDIARLNLLATHYIKK